ncbi:endonuclease/exonuclease/phosphatase family protein [Gordonia sp. HY285]|uniref:endonuclease/exonuclease/phosphatase family protein n=1 Tax=Gordonia liuliyuniae TaxID=2911517 RepID=UPI001F17CC9C|nr:endonuclease/exonuclease/phosphatase family protein [Gordonia liuliyuniae]MCF8612211.1 endonuclease/exonuclease/phosphatase family protein [Gordonia liuliyuniae]
MGEILRWTANIIGTVALIVAAVALALYFWPTSQVPVVAIASVSPVIVGVSVVLALACLSATRAWWRVGFAVAVAVAAIGVQAPYFAAADAPSGEPITVLTSNVMFGEGDVEELARLVRDNRVDVLAVQELTSDEADRIAASSIADDLPHAFVRAGSGAEGTALYSRHPLSDEVEYPRFVFNQLSAVVAVPGRGDVQVFALHPVPPTITPQWESELGRIDEIVHDAPENRPVIAMGDFNSTLDHARFRQLLTGGYRDAGEIAGVGWLPTYPTDKWFPAIVGIDHVLVRGLSAADVTSHDVPGTDHKAVLAHVG